MLRTFDHAGYYETRLIVTALSLVIVGYFLYYKSDRRYLLMFISGAFFTTLLEYYLQMRGMRGAGYSFSLFGWYVPRNIGPIIQGLLEGGAWGVFAFWFADLRSSRARMSKWLPYLIGVGIAFILSCVIGYVARNYSISSVRPIFATSLIGITTTIIFASLLIAWRKNAIPDLANFYGGLLVYTFLTLEPFHLLGARYVTASSALRSASITAPVQTGLTILSHIFESAGGRLHFFMIPFALGWVALSKTKKSGDRERYSTQHLQDLAQRGWRRRSKPFKRG